MRPSSGSASQEHLEMTVDVSEQPFGGRLRGGEKGAPPCRTPDQVMASVSTVVSLVSILSELAARMSAAGEADEGAHN